jgi:hypothetical protein
LHAILFNARSIANKWTEIFADLLLLRSFPDLIFVTESWLLPNMNYVFRGLEHYVVHRRDRDERGGGVLVLINPQLSFSVPQLTLPSCECELFVFDLISSVAGCIRFFLIYRPPRTTLANSNLLCDFLLQDDMWINNRAIVLGDLNLPNLPQRGGSLPVPCDAHTALFHDTFVALRLVQLVSFPTRIDNILDIICAPKQPSAVIVSHVCDAGPMANCDHSAVTFDISFCNAMPNVKRTATATQFFCFSKCNFDEADRMLRSIDWPTLLSIDQPTDHLLDIFMDTCMKVIIATVPRIHLRSFRVKPLPKHIRRLCLAKKRAWRAYCRSKSAVHKRRFRQLATEVQDVCTSLSCWQRKCPHC